jgi:PAS domain-containing protein
VRLASETGHGTLEAEAEGSALRLTLRAAAAGEPPLDRLLLEAAQEELALLRGLAEAAPQPIWATDADHRLVWANRAYLDLADRAAAGRDPPGGPHWPCVPLFAPTGDPPRRREALLLPDGGEPLWFDVTEVPREGGTLGVATEVSDLVRAEAARAQFVQSLAKTFAHLSTGLAIFDRERRLALFNPAFVELTGLSPALLSGRPLVHSVLDRLRDAGVLPEPRDYAGWREEVAALEAAAATGHYADIWTLPSGRTLRVTGRPHPDGALAFLFEDISAELGQTRRLRAEAEAAYAALDATGEALALFDAAGALLVASAAYRDLWGPPAADLAAEADRWAEGCGPSPAWAALRDGPRPAPRDEAVARRDGRSLRLRATPLPRGGTLVAFRPEPS